MGFFFPSKGKGQEKEFHQGTIIKTPRVKLFIMLLNTYACILKAQYVRFGDL